MTKQAGWSYVGWWGTNRSSTCPKPGGSDDHFGFLF
jgi:hypothetical protein